jgi:hypothetical protein
VKKTSSIEPVQFVAIDILRRLMDLMRHEQPNRTKKERRR